MLWIVGIAVVVVLIWAMANWIYHAVRKPTELLGPVSGAFTKTPAETWQAYGAHFRQHATAAISPELLAALAQIEASGNPVAQTYWRWQPSLNPFHIYRPASSAMGMYQIIDGTYAQHKPACRPDSEAPSEQSCWFDSLYTRVVPSEAIALAAKMLDGGVTRTLRRHHVGATAAQKQDLAIVIHLCGAGAGETFARRRFRAGGGQHCGDHDVRAYLDRVNAMKRVFARLAKAG
ncbi:MAG: transglycosylase SLT domain-containing protein [Rhodocyclaceae bacterium]